MKFDITHAISSLCPGATWTLVGENFEDIQWMDTEVAKPTKSQVLAEVARLQAEYDALEYRRLRAAEYPDFKEYLDGVVKGDQAQIDAYIAACLAVKDKYPKPE